MTFFGSIKHSVKQTNETHIYAAYIIFSIWTESPHKNMPQLKMTSHLDPGASACRAAVGQQCNLSKKLWNSNVLLHNNAMCNQWMSDNLGESCTTKRELDGSLQCTARDQNADVTHSGGRRRTQMTLRCLFSVCGHFKLVCRAFEENDTF